MVDHLRDCRNGKNSREADLERGERFSNHGRRLSGVRGAIRANATSEALGPRISQYPARLAVRCWDHAARHGCC
jgi:hypothetical protein